MPAHKLRRGAVEVGRDSCASDEDDVGEVLESQKIGGK